MTFNAQSTTDEVLAGIDLSGKTAVVTGASGGLGAETARALASKNATVIMASRNLAKTAEKAEELKILTGNAKIAAIALDLADIHSAQKASAEISQQYPVIDILINNAGLMACPYELTAQGLESQFGVNHVGHFVFTLGLLESLKRALSARVVALSSGGHKFGTVDLSDPNFSRVEYNKWQAYGAAKTANALFAVELNRLYANQGVTANAVHPGMIRTDLGRHLTPEDIAFIMGGAGQSDAKVAEPKQTNGQGRASSSIRKSIPAGAATSVWAATSPSLDRLGGLYLEDCQIAEQVEAGVQSHGFYAHAVDQKAAKALWQYTENLIAEL
jgi:NAD(P)-dependent dehydrogenase (short-subunit alcohol dehydrogenase family)